MFCARCGSKIAPGSEFCPSCGARVAHKRGVQQELSPQLLYASSGAPRMEKFQTILVAVVFLIAAAALYLYSMLGRKEPVIVHYSGPTPIITTDDEGNVSVTGRDDLTIDENGHIAPVAGSEGSAETRTIPLSSEERQSLWVWSGLFLVVAILVLAGQYRVVLRASISVFDDHVEGIPVIRGFIFNYSSVSISLPSSEVTVLGKPHSTRLSLKTARGKRFVFIVMDPKACHQAIQSIMGR